MLLDQGGGGFGSKEKHKSTTMISAREQWSERDLALGTGSGQDDRCRKPHICRFAGGRDGGQEERDVREKVRQTGATGTSLPRVPQVAGCTVSFRTRARGRVGVMMMVRRRLLFLLRVTMADAARQDG